MKLKKSFFNKTIFWKNVTLYWPMWAAYTVILIFLQPVILWINMYDARNYSFYTYSDRLSDFQDVFMMEPHILLIAFGAIIIGMALFHYLYNSKSANMIHSFPVDRTQLFCTNVISGIAFLAVPQLITSILTTIVAMAYGITQLEAVVMWFFLCLGTDIVAFAVVTFCAMFTGHIVAMPIYVFIVNYFVYWIYYLIEVVVTTWGYGVENVGRHFLNMLDYCCPLNAFLLFVDIFDIKDKNDHCIGAAAEGIEVVLVYLVIAVVLYAAAYMVYRKRQIEQAGEILTVNWVKPIFRFGVGMTAGFFGAWWMREILHSIGFSCGLFGFLLWMLVIGAIAYFIADMLVKKSFHVFKKKNWMNCGIFSVVMLACFGALYLLSSSIEVYVPKLDDVQTATICMGYDIAKKEEEADEIVEIHQAIVENLDIFEEYMNAGNSRYEYVEISYFLENDTYICRSYRLPYEDAALQDIYKQICKMEQEPENYLKHVFCENYENITEFNDGWIEAQFASNGNEEMDYRYDTIEFTPEQIKELYEAVIADVRAGTLMRYNVNTQWNAETTGDVDVYAKYSEVYLRLGYKDPDEKTENYVNVSENSWGSTTQEYVEYESWHYAHVNVGPDCENVVNKLIEFGVMESVDDIWWGEINY